MAGVTGTRFCGLRVGEVEVVERVEAGQLGDGRRVVVDRDVDDRVRAVVARAGLDDEQGGRLLAAAVAAGAPAGDEGREQARRERPARGLERPCHRVHGLGRDEDVALDGERLRRSRPRPARPRARRPAACPTRPPRHSNASAPVHVAARPWRSTMPTCRCSGCGSCADEDAQRLLGRRAVAHQHEARAAVVQPGEALRRDGPGRRPRPTARPTRTLGNLDCTAMPISPVVVSTATIENVDTSGSPCGVGRRRAPARRPARATTARPRRRRRRGARGRRRPRGGALSGTSARSEGVALF